MRQLAPYLREHRLALLVVAALSLLVSMGTLAPPLLIREVLDRIGRHDPVAAGLIALIAVLLVLAVLDAVRHYLLQRTAEGLVLTLRRSLIARLLRLPIAEYDRRQSGDLLSRVGADTTLVRAAVTSGLMEASAGLVTAMGATIAMLVLDPVLFGAAIASLAIGLAIGLRVARRIKDLSHLAQESLGEMTATAHRAIIAARTIRAGRAEEREIAVVRASAERSYRASLRIARLQAMLRPAMSLAIQGSFLLVLGVGGARVATGTISIGDLVAFVMLLFVLLVPLGGLLDAYADLQTGLGALERIEEVMGLPIEVDDPGVGIVPGSAFLEIKDLSFGYEGTAAPALRNVSFTVPAGTRTALVGPSGAGKSTLLSLIERFYELDSGRILLGGVDIRHMSRGELRARLGYVEQEAPVLAGTLRDNLRLAQPDATDEQMLDVLHAVNLDELVRRTPLGLGAQVGEGGVLLSGGQRQRLAIARALLAAPDVLLLDEPTSNLDSRNELALRTAIDRIAHSRTVLIVAHRLSTVVDADQIVVLDRGEVVGAGTHQNLLRNSPLYRELANHHLLAGAIT